MRTTSIKIASFASLIALIAAACGPSGPDASELNAAGKGTSGGSAGTGVTSGTGGTGSSSAGTGGSTGGTGSSTGGTGVPMAGKGGSPTTGAGGSSTAGSSPTAGTGTGGTGGASTGGDGAGAAGGTGGADVGGSGGTGSETGGTAGTTGESGGTGGTGNPDDPYAPRTGSFKMLVYSLVCCGAFPHDSRPAGQRMLQAIGQKQGFEVTIAQDDSEINPEGLAKYEIVFFLNSTGDLWSSGNLRRDFETWIRNNGAYAGMHGATDSGSSWAFYKELTGQYYDQHDNVSSGTIQWTTEGLQHVVGSGLPNPWNRREEWYKFNSWENWSGKPGFTVLNTVTTTGGGTRPVSYVREWENIRAFYTSLGHEDAPYTDDTVIKHVTAGIMWAVRRQDLIVP